MRPRGKVHLRLVRHHYLIDCVPDQDRLEIFSRKRKDLLGAKRQLREWGIDVPVSHVVVATCAGTLVGFFRFNQDDNLEITAAGTWVDSRFRKRGIALRMWRLALTRLKPKNVEVVTATTLGRALVNKVKLHHPKIKFIIW